MIPESTTYIHHTPYGGAQRWEDKEAKTVNMFYLDHYLKVRRARQKDVEERTGEEGGRIFGHPLEGKEIVFKRNPDVKYYIQSIHRHWDKGYYLMLMYYYWYEVQSEMLCEKKEDGKMYGKSHGCLYYENISSQCPNVINYINKNRGTFVIKES